ncbi:MAG: hypothetical protein Q9201_004808 [Fulgogasparrea decipioides]
MVEWHADIEAFKITLRQSIPGGWREFVKTSTPGDDEAPRDESIPKPGHGGSSQPSAPSSTNQESKQPFDGKTTHTNASKDHDAANSGVDDVPKHEEASEEMIITCPDPSSQLSPLDRPNFKTSALLIALDIGNNHHNLQNICTHLDWLDLAPRNDMKEIVLGYHQMSPRAIREYLEEANNSVSKLTMPIPPAPDSVVDVPSAPVNYVPSTLDIDLNAIFGGQGATDLDDDEEIPRANEEDEEVDVVFSYAQSLLDNRRIGLPLSHYFPSSQRIDGSIWIAFQSRPFPYNGEGARLVASEVAYEYFRKCLETLREEGSVLRPMLAEADRSKGWFFQQPDRAGKLPYDPRPCKGETLRHDISKSGRTDAGAVRSRFEHFNFFRQRVQFRSTTPATVSLYAQTVCQRKPIHHCMSRQGVIMSQANKYIDPVYYNGPQELLLLEGTAFQDQTTGYVVKVNDPRGAFGDHFDGETAIRDLDDIDAYHLASQWHTTRMQQPYIMDHREHSQSALADVKINAPAYHPPKETYRKRNAQGACVQWALTGASKPIDTPSKLSFVQSVNDDENEKEGEEIEEYSPSRPLIPGLQAAHEDWQPQEMSDEEALKHVNELFAQFTIGNKSLMEPNEDNGDQAHCAATSHDLAGDAGPQILQPNNTVLVPRPLRPTRITSHVPGNPFKAATPKQPHLHTESWQHSVGSATNEDPMEILRRSTSCEIESSKPVLINKTTVGTHSRRVSGDSTLSYHQDTSDEEDHSSRGTTPEVEMAAATDYPSSSNKRNVATAPSTAPAPQKPVGLQQITDCCTENTGAGSHSQHAGAYAAFIFGFAIAASFFW